MFTEFETEDPNAPRNRGTFALALQKAAFFLLLIMKKRKRKKAASGPFLKKAQGKPYFSVRPAKNRGRGLPGRFLLFA